MGVFLILALVAGAVYLGAFLFLAVAVFRVNVWWGLGTLFSFLFGPLGTCLNGMVFAIRHWQEGGARFLTMLLSAIAAFVFLVAMIFSNPKVTETFWKGYAQGRARHGYPVAQTTRGPQDVHEAHDLAENEPPAATPMVDPYAAQRAALAKHGADLTAEYQRLNVERAALKPGGGGAVKSFNAKAAHYQSGLQALQAEQRQLDALDHPGSVAVSLPTASPAVDGSKAAAVAGGIEGEANAAFLRLRTSVGEGNYAGFTATLRKCLADYRQTKVFPQITAYAKQVMREAPPAKLGAALQQQAQAAQREYDATTRQLQAIVNQTPPTVVPPQGSTEVYRYLYDPGAIKPDFNVADVVTGRESWKGDYIYMQTRPGIFYRSADCEFNPQTKYFYTDRNVPKKKLTAAENAEIVRLYRVLGKDETILGTLPQRLAKADQTSAELLALNTQIPGAK